MDIDINYQKIIKKLKIRLFKCERYFEYFKILLLSLNLSKEDSIKKTKVYNLIQSKHSIQKEQTTQFWHILYISLQKPSIKFPDEISILEEKYLQFYSKNIYKYLCSISILYSAEMNVLKQEYLNLCIKFINTKNKRLKTLKILTKNNLRQSLYESRNKTNKKDIKDIKDKNNNNNNENNDNNEKSFDDDDDDEKNRLKKFGEGKHPKTLLEKEIFRLKMKSSNEVVDEFIGDINNDLLINKKKEICFLHFIKTKKNKIFRRYLSNQTKKVLKDMNDNDLLYKNEKDKYESIFTLEMKIKNQNYRNSKKKKDKYQIKLKKNNNTINEENKGILLLDNKNNKSNNNNNSNNNKIKINKKLLMNLSNNTNFSPKININNLKKLPKCFSFKLKKDNPLFLPFLRNKDNKNNKVLNTEQFGNAINKKYFINGNDLFY